ncbi:MAG: DsbE family thiol:disulfide interchange protein [Pseudomonadota bacterium]|nr:DsbE family thiol:disulfide interchange protein [Pseudomonadota bacterium]
MQTMTRRRMMLLAPLAVAGAAGGAFTALLMRMEQGRYDPHALPSMLIGKALPHFSLPSQSPSSSGFSSNDVIAARRPALINFFASWCAPCVEEAPALAEVRDMGLPIWGVAYKDQEAATAQFLARLGDPYVRVGRDAPGLVGIDFGVYGVPESYLVDGSGIVRWRWAGGLSSSIVRDQLAPLLKVPA